MSDYTALNKEQIKALHLSAQGDLRSVKAQYMQLQGASYEDLRAAATIVLELRCEIERRLYGKVKLNRRATLASLMR